jgi:hypothetical protein
MVDPATVRVPVKGVVLTTVVVFGVPVVLVC